MNTKALRQKVLDLAIHGKLVPQNPNDESATVLLEKIRAEKAEKIKKGELKTDKKDSFIFTKECEFDEDKLGKCSSGTRHKRHYEQFADGTVKDIEDEIPFEVPEGWAWCRLGEICEVSSAKRVLQQDWKTSGIPFYRAREIAQLSNNETVKDDLFITSELYNELKQKYGVPIAGDLMVSAVGTIGKVYIVKDTDCFYYKDASVICFSKKEKSIDSLYLKLCCESDFLQEQMYSQSKGTTVDTITINKAQNYLIPLPPIFEQQKIVHSIQDFFGHIGILEQNKSELQFLINAAKSKILNLAIHGKLVPQDPNDEPAEELLKRIATSDNRPYKKFEGEVPFDIPESWIWMKIPDLCTISIKDGTHKTPTYADKENGIPFLSSKDVTSGKIDWSKIKYITKELHEELYKRIAPQKNDILLAKNGTTGVAALVEDDTIFDIYVTLAVIRPNCDIVNPQYLLFIINSQFCKNQFDSHLLGIGVPNLHLNEINKTSVPIPPLAEQQRIVSKIEELFSYLDTLSSNLE